MHEPLSATDLSSQWGLHPTAIARLSRGGELLRLRRNAYLSELDLDERQRHVALLRGTVPEFDRPMWFSHVSATILHELPLWRLSPEQAWLTTPEGGHGRITADAHVRLCALPPHHRAEVLDLPVTTLARTVADMARTAELATGLAIADAALRSGLDRTELEEVAAFQRRWPGARKLKVVTQLADPRAESPLESASRLLMFQGNIAKPELQYEIRHEGRFIARSDFAWPELRVVGESDGLVKYDSLAGAGNTALDVALKEKRRDQELRNAGWWVIHWGAKDLANPTQFLTSLRRALMQRQAA